MLGSITHIIYGIILLGLLIQSYRLWQDQNQLYLLFMFGVILGLTYDNWIIGLGRFIGEGSTLQALNVPRYWLHAFLTPGMMFVGLALARNAGVKWAWGRVGTAIVITLMTLMVALGVYSDVILLELQPAFNSGTIRYANEGGLPGPPIAAIITIIVLLVCGVAIFRKARWAWLMVGALVMFVTSAGGSAFGIITNIGEIALAAGMVVTAQRFVAVENANDAVAMPA